MATSIRSFVLALKTRVGVYNRFSQSLSQDLARKIALETRDSYLNHTVIRNASWTKIFKGSKDGEVQPAEVEVAIRKLKRTDGPTTLSRLNSLKKKTVGTSVRGYSPPPDVEEKVINTVSDVMAQQVDLSTKLDDRLLKFKVLTRLMEELDHTVPNTELSMMDTVGDVLTFFSSPVVDRSAYEDLSKLNLPRNLHIQMEPVRFDPETDTFFDGQTAFPGRPTVVTSLKYRRKYKGNSGESRNQRSITEFERQKELEADRARLRWKSLPSEGE
ncbi:39S ribosomal protein L50, mitochondrial [Elysia marginata]|uniref:Large ribosomal subunit protein mL50 n=1 Tax=Elysia marginata TaxID=1093978 RepID=A0AAV4FDY8_9GAST|nr:39S ribosomal protein L50, mitochondrial [Elysia marginata]